GELIVCPRVIRQAPRPLAVSSGGDNSLVANKQRAIGPVAKLDLCSDFRGAGRLFTSVVPGKGHWGHGASSWKFITKDGLGGIGVVVIAFLLEGLDTGWVFKLQGPVGRVENMASHI